eukprot:Pgem_evm1s16071
MFIHLLLFIYTSCTCIIFCYAGLDNITKADIMNLNETQKYLLIVECNTMFKNYEQLINWELANFKAPKSTNSKILDVYRQNTHKLLAKLVIIESALAGGSLNIFNFHNILTWTKITGNGVKDPKIKVASKSAGIAAGHELKEFLDAVRAGDDESVLSGLRDGSLEAIAEWSKEKKELIKSRLAAEFAYRYQKVAKTLPELITENLEVMAEKISVFLNNIADDGRALLQTQTEFSEITIPVEEKEVTEAYKETKKQAKVLISEAIKNFEEQITNFEIIKTFQTQVRKAISTIDYSKIEEYGKEVERGAFEISEEFVEGVKESFERYHPEINQAIKELPREIDEFKQRWGIFYKEAVSFFDYYLCGTGSDPEIDAGEIKISDGFKIIDDTLVPTEKTNRESYISEAAELKQKYWINISKLPILPPSIRKNYKPLDVISEDGRHIIPANEIAAMDSVTREVKLKNFLAHIKGKSLVSISAANTLIGLVLIVFQIKDIKNECDSIDAIDCTHLVMQSVTTAAIAIGIFAAVSAILPAVGEVMGLALGILALISEFAKLINPPVVPPHPMSVNNKRMDRHCQEKQGFIGIAFLETQNDKTHYHSILYNEMLSQDQTKPTIVGYGGVNKLKSYLENLKCDECMTAVKYNPFFKDNRTIYKPSINGKRGIDLALPCWFHCEKKTNTVKYGFTLTLDPLDQFANEKSVAVSTETPNKEHHAYFKYQCIKSNGERSNTIFKRYFTAAENSGFFMQKHTAVFYSADVDNGEDKMILNNIVKGKSGQRYFAISYAGGGNVTILDKDGTYSDYIGTKGYYCRLDVWNRIKKKYEATYIALDLPNNQCKNSDHFRTDEDYICLKNIMTPICDQYLDQFNNDAYLKLLPRTLGFPDVKKPCAFSVPIFDRKDFRNLNNLEDFKRGQALGYLSRTRNSGTANSFQNHDIFCSGNNKRIQIGNLKYKSGWGLFGFHSNGRWETDYLHVIDFSNNENGKFEVIELTSTDNHDQVNHNFVYRCYDGNTPLHMSDIRFEAALPINDQDTLYHYLDAFSSNKIRLAVIKEGNGYAVRYIDGGKVTANDNVQTIPNAYYHGG